MHVYKGMNFLKKAYKFCKILQLDELDLNNLSTLFI